MNLLYNNINHIRCMLTDIDKQHSPYKVNQLNLNPLQVKVKDKDVVEEEVKVKEEEVKVKEEEVEEV